MLLRVDSRLGLGGGGFGEVGAGGARSPRGAVNEEEDQQGEEGSDGVEEGIPAEAVREATKDWWISSRVE